jgi:hypothetical protein
MRAWIVDDEAPSRGCETQGERVSPIAGMGVIET